MRVQWPRFLYVESKNGLKNLCEREFWTQAPKTSIYVLLNRLLIDSGGSSARFRARCERSSLDILCEAALILFLWTKEAPGQKKTRLSTRNMWVSDTTEAWVMLSFPHSIKRLSGEHTCKNLWNQQFCIWNHLVFYYFITLGGRKPSKNCCL